MESFRWNEREKSCIDLGADARDRVGATTEEQLIHENRERGLREKSSKGRREREREGRRGRKTQLVVWTRSFEEGTGSAPLVGAETEKCRETAPRDSAVVFLYHVNLMRDRNGAQGLEVSRAGAILSIYRAVRRLSSSVPVFSSWWTPLIARSTSQRIVKNRVSSVYR